MIFFKWYKVLSKFEFIFNNKVHVNFSKHWVDFANAVLAIVELLECDTNIKNVCEWL